MRNPPPHRRKRSPWDRAQRAPQVLRPGSSPLAQEMRTIDTADWALVVCIGRDGTAQVHGRRTPAALKALRMVVAEAERWETPS